MWWRSPLSSPRRVAVSPGARPPGSEVARARGPGSAKRLVAIAALALIATFARADDLPRPPNALAVTDPIQLDLESLARRGVVDLPGLDARPLMRFDVARALERALAADSTLALDATFRRALRAFSTELDADRGGEGERSLLGVRDRDNWLRVEAFSSADAEASPDHGFATTDSTRLGIRGSWIVWPNFHLFEEIYIARIPRGHLYGDPLSPGTDFNTSTERVYLGLHTRYADLTFGRDRQAWGPGARGSLLLSASAPPFTQLRLARAFFDGRLNAVVVNGILDQAEHRYVSFHRLDWRAHHRLRLGFEEGVRYDAGGFEPLYLIGIIPYQVVSRLLLRDNQSRSTDAAVRDNVMVGLDASWDAVRSLTLYGEGLLDDLHVMSDDHPTRLAYQFGAYRVGRLMGREWRTRLEWTRVWNWVYATFYHADFVHEGKPLGYPLGPDSRAIDLSSEWIAGRDLSLSIRLSRRDQGEGTLGAAWQPHDPAFAGRPASRFQGVVETEQRLALGARYAPTERVAMFVEAGPAWVTNAGHVPGSEQRGWPGRLGASFRY